jgi:4-hydroxybenzoate polyprenyltransferase
VLVDAFCIAAGFLLRVLAGARAADVTVSHWLLLCTIFLALFLALCKRHSEIHLLGEDRGGHRKILLEYNPAFLDQVVTIVAACTIVCYTMYTVAPDTQRKFGGESLVMTVPFVVFGLFRYLLLVQTKGGGGNPTRVLLGGDLTFVLNCIAWLLLVSAIVFRWIQ